MDLLPCRTFSFAGLVSKLGKNKEMAQPCCVLPVARLIAARNPRMGIYLTCKSPEVRCLNVGLLFRSISTSSVVGKLVSRDSSCRHVCRISSSDMTSQLELGKQNHAKRVNGIFWILLLNLGLYVADHWFLIREVKALYLYHARPTWFQFLTATFCHANWNHLSSNLFFLYIFGKLVEEEEGNLALWISYILTGAGANLVSWLVLPRNAVSVGASGAVFGLFAISVLVKIRWDWRKILEVLILGQFVIQRVMEAAQASAGMSGTFGGSLQNVNHIAHLSGALIGVVLIWLVSSIPSSDQEKSKKTEI